MTRITMASSPADEAGDQADERAQRPRRSAATEKPTISETREP